MSTAIWALTLALSTLPSHSQTTFRDPLFSSQDPYLVWWQGNYYYADSGNNQIRIRKSPTLAGLAAQAPQPVWTATLWGPDGRANIWAPEIHIINGKSYLYYSADFQSNGDHKLYVLEGGADPMGAYTPGDTGAPNGQILESTGLWAIDPDVFYGVDGQLYLTWSCTDDEIGTPPQSLCLARMSDPFHVSSATVKVATPTEPWEERTAPIEEGPVGFVRGSATYLTYSASASWTTNDYAVGLLMNPSGDLLDPNAWNKRGPILDHHGTSYGPGSAVFIPSPDGSELWALYHGYDSLNCPQWGCRSIRMQKVKWTADGMPLLGYPFDPGVPQFVPSGDSGIGAGWGNSALGAAASGSWTVQSSSSLDSTQDPADRSRQEIFRGDISLFSYVASVQARQAASEGPAGVYGVYGLYRDAGNYVEAFVDLANSVFGTRSTVGGEPQTPHLFPLPPAFDPDQVHTITIQKTAAQQFVFELDGVALDERAVPLVFGQVGVFTEGGGAEFREVTVADSSSGWGNAYGDIAEGRERSAAPDRADGYVQGDWEIKDGASANSLSTGEGWHALYQGEPNLGSFAVQTDVQWIESGKRLGESRYGLIVCYDDRDNNVSMWINPRDRKLLLDVAIAGNATSQQVPLPGGFDPYSRHTIGATKVNSQFVFLLDGSEVFREELGLANGTSGIATENTLANFENYQRQPL